MTPRPPPLVTGRGEAGSPKTKNVQPVPPYGNNCAFSTLKGLGSMWEASVTLRALASAGLERQIVAGAGPPRPLCFTADSSSSGVKPPTCLPSRA